MNVYKLPAVVRCEATFTDADDVLATPTVISFVLKSPNGTRLVYTTPDPAIVIDSTGVAHVDVTPSAIGPYRYTFKHRFGPTGPLISNAEPSFAVERSTL